MTTWHSKIICNKFGGIRQRNSLFQNEMISAQDMQNIEFYYTGENSGVGIRTAKGNIAIFQCPDNESVVNIFSTISAGTQYFIVHTVNNNFGRLYLYNFIDLTLVQDNLSNSRVATAKDFQQGYSDLFVFSDGTTLLTLEIANNNNVVIVDDVDPEGRQVKGHIIAIYDGRLWLIDGNIVRYSVEANVYDWHSSDIDVSTSAGFIELVKPITAGCLYLSSLAIFFTDSSLLIEGSYPYEIDKRKEGPAGCAGIGSLVFHDTDLFFYDDTKKSIFSFQQVVLGEKTLGASIADEIQSYFQDIDKSRLNEIRALSVVLEDRDEIWFYIPTYDQNYSTILIFDYRTREWIKRKCQKINCFGIHNNILYSGSEATDAGGGKILQEYQGNTFDGEYIQHYYYCSAFNLGSDTTLKVTKFPPRVSLNLPYINDFFVKYIKNYNTFKRPKIKHIRTKFKNFLIWGQGFWGKNYWSSSLASVSAQAKFPTSTFKILEIQIYTENEKQSFALKNFEISDIKVKQV